MHPALTRWLSLRADGAVTRTLFRRRGPLRLAPLPVLVGERMQHDFPLTLPWLAESRRACAAIAAFIKGGLS